MSVKYGKGIEMWLKNGGSVWQKGGHFQSPIVTEAWEEILEIEKEIFEMKIKHEVTWTPL